MDSVHKGAEELLAKYIDHEENNSWNALFMELHEISEKQERDLELSYEVSLSPKNLPKNRYCNVVPYDQHLVELKDTYINASKLTVPLTKKGYIFTQGPLENTSADFWHMVWEEECKTVVMLCTFMERGVPKCFPYFPHIGDKIQNHGEYSVELIEEKGHKHYTVRTLRLRKGEKEDKLVQHFQYTTWPDFGVPENVKEFLDFVEAVRDYDDEVDSPIICHCSAGIGRTGTFTVVDVLVTAIRAQLEEPLPSIDDLIVFLRQYRMSLVQTPAQLRFSWKAVVEYIKSKVVQNVEDRSVDNGEYKIEDANNGQKEKVTRKASTLPRKRRSEGQQSPGAAAQKRKSEEP
ncbi:unnamed protein product [Bursaphelenchus xylophilus]|uniref:protein-tyrosine-phosphatase n=1 Tax=Bursaphelenchus xylophilus TaxID=6326 RepID=A0A1I7S7H3_BURXY|nr:unnamed protein product [Bursaphelenchus xylophilus]CAG9085093.1 unnamed protein product [Bursaphelenchus xylophilus]